MRIALVVYDGVLDDECIAFRSVLQLMAASDVVTVGAARGAVAGPGGAQIADLAFDELADADVVVVPGGLGCERAADDPALRAFLVRMERRARYLAASSTGTVVLAAAGLLHGDSAATHWLASELLERYGSEADDRRLVVQGNVITCEGRISGVDAAFAIVERIGGSSEVDRIRATLLERGEDLLRPSTPWESFLERALGRTTLLPERRPKPPRSSAPIEAPATPLSVMIDLVDDEQLVRRMKRRADRSRRG